MKMKKFRSLRSKNFFTMAAILLVSFAMLGSVFSAFSYQYLRREKKAGMLSAAREALRLVTAYHEEMELGELEVRMAISTVAGIGNYHILVCDDGGTVVSCSDRSFDCGHVGMCLPETVLQQLEDTGVLTAMTDLGGMYDSPRYVVAESSRTEMESDTPCYVVLSCDMPGMMGIWRQFALIFVLTASSVMLLAFIVSIITSERLTRPIKAIAAAADRFAGGDYTARVSGHRRNDEVGELTEAFNAMADSIEHQERQRREFIANVSHELKTPMTTITGFADGILDGTIPPEHHAKYLATISSETKRLSRLVRNMLETSRLQAMDKMQVLQKSFEITEVVGMTLLGLEGKINARGLDVDASIPEDRITVRGDRDSITQVVYNLMDNAVKFSTPGSALGVEVYKKDKKVYVSVRNTGETISPEELPLIFDRFHKTDKSRSKDPEGVGLGLYIVKTILTNHGEDIFVTSDGGVTTFTFTLTGVQGEAIGRS